MRAVRVLSFALLVAMPAMARAETDATAPKDSTATPTPAPPKAQLPPYRLIRILPETNQALLLDKKRGKHVLVDVGDSIGPYQVIEIDTDQVVLSKPDDTREFVLVAGEATPTARLPDPYPMADPSSEAPKPTPTDPAAALLDPYPPGTIDPYGSEGVREVEAPADQRVDKTAPKPAKPADTKPAKPADTKPADTKPAKPADTKPAKPADTKPAKPADTKPADTKPAADAPPTSFAISRKQLDAALSDFVQIGKDVQMSAGDTGVTLAKVAPGSFFYRMGLRDGDLVRKVDGTAIHGLDDAAVVYARLGKAKKFTVEITRDGAPVTLTYKITK